jgi:hypothetical protein
MPSLAAETWTISEAQRLALQGQIQRAFDGIPLAAYESARRAGLCRSVAPGSPRSDPAGFRRHTPREFHDVGEMTAADITEAQRRRG